MTDTRLMYGATESTTEALLAPQVPKSVSQAVAPFVAECLGTFVFVFTTGCCLLSPGDPVWNATAIGSIFMVMVYATAPVSGGHLNPAVSFALGLVGSLSWPAVVGYWAAQSAGAIGAAFCFCALFSPQTVRVEPGPPYTWQYAAAAEATYTFMLCFVVLNCAVSRRNNPREDANQFYGMAAGFAVIAGGSSAGPISGAWLNPALAVALDASSAPAGSTGGWSLTWAGAELAGGLAAAVLFRLVRPEEFGPEEDMVGYEPGILSKCLGEIVGTFLVVVTAGLNLAVTSAAGAMSTGAVLLALTYSLANVSGAHFNPAVTVAMVLRGRCSVAEAVAYIVSQLCAAVGAGAAYGAFHTVGPNKDRILSLGPGKGFSMAAAGGTEMLFTFVVAYVVLSCVTIAPPASWRTKQSAYSGLAVGSSFAAGGLAAGTVSGVQLNPAVCLGLTMANLYENGLRISQTPLTNCLAFSAWEVAGGFVAGVIFRRTHPSEFRSMPLLAK